MENSHRNMTGCIRAWVRSVATFALCLLALGSIHALWAEEEAALDGESYRDAVMLGQAFLDTAKRIRDFETSKSMYGKSPEGLATRLTSVVSALEVLRGPFKNKRSEAVDKAALDMMMREPEAQPYAKPVMKLWEQVFRTAPLSHKFIATTICPELVPLLDTREVSQDVDVVDEGSPVFVYILLALVLLLVVVVVLVVLEHRRKAREREEAAQREEEEKRRRQEEEEKRRLEELRRQEEESQRVLPTDPTASWQASSPKLKDLNLRQIKGRWKIVIRTENGTEQHLLNRTVMSIGRRDLKSSGHSRTDIVIDTQDRSVSRWHGLLRWSELRYPRAGLDGYWVFVLNQDGYRVQGYDCIAPIHYDGDMAVYAMIVIPNERVTLSDNGEVSFIIQKA